MIIKEEILFNASTSDVWNLLINPEMTKQYMFGCEAQSDWKIGSPILWNARNESGEEVTYVKGEVIVFEEKSRLTVSMFDPNSGLPDIPRNYVYLTYEILPQTSGCKLIIIQGDFQSVDNADKRFEESRQGWKLVIPIMRKLLGE